QAPPSAVQQSPPSALPQAPPPSGPPLAPTAAGEWWTQPTIGPPAEVADVREIPGLFREPYKRSPGRHAADPKGSRDPRGADRKPRSQALQESIWGPARFAAPTPAEPGFKPPSENPAYVEPGWGDLPSLSTPGPPAPAGAAGDRPSAPDRNAAPRRIGGRGRTRSRPNELPKWGPSGPPPPPPSTPAHWAGGGPPWSRPPARSLKSRKSPLFIIIGCAVAVLVVAFLLNKPSKPTKPSAQTSAHPGTVVSPTPAADATGYTLIEVGGPGQVGSTGAVTLDVLGVTRKTLPNVQAQAYPEEPIPISGGAAVIEGGTAYRISGVNATPVDLGPADHLFPAATNGLVGVYRAGTGGQSATMQMVAVTASASSSPVSVFPAGWQPVAQANTGIVIEQPQNGNLGLELWQPNTSPGAAVLKSWGPAKAVVDVSGNEMAWLAADGCDPQGECPLHITNLSTFADTIAKPPPGYSGFLASGAFSPDNVDTLAILVYDASTGFAQARLALVQTASGSATAGTWLGSLLPQAEVTPGKTIPGHVCWTPDGGRILFAGGSGSIQEFALGDVQSYPLSVGASYGFTVY
ncbi:MAG TPA: hypothetical protein VKY26_13015, partial [Actinomycetota bacterium]|nr:hypothetical protein [Actinomycetota bacterium]